MSPSHIAESFQLKLCIDADQLLSPPSLTSSPNLSSLPDGLCFRPSQIEEDTIRGFGALLSRIQITDIAPSSVTVQQLEDLVRQLSPVTGASVVTSPPEGNSPIELYAGDAADFLRAAFLIWVTEVRPTLVAQNSSCGCVIPGEQCVLLAELSFTVGTVGTALQVVGTVTIDETHRPYLLETRLLQECLLNGRVGSGTGSGGAQTGSAVVAAGTFSISLAGQATAVGPTFNNLTATSQGSGAYLLKWSGFPGYLKPTSSPPSSTTYVVKGTAMGDAAQGPFVLHFAGFLPQGIQIVVQKVAGLVAPTGFSVEISEITRV
jgi:hypothetical protein